MESVRKKRIGAGLLIGWRWVVLCMGLAALLQSAAFVAAAEGKGSPVPDLAERWGIEVTAIRMAAAGHMVDFRYRVLDETKAAALFQRSAKPYLIDEASGKVLAVPNMAKVGPLRTTEPPKKDRTYWMFFGTPPGLVRSGSNVTVVIGDFRLEHVEVE